MGYAPISSEVKFSLQFYTLKSLFWQCRKSLTDNLKLRIFSSKGQINSYHEVTITTFHLKNSCMNRAIVVLINGNHKCLVDSYLQESDEMLCLSIETAAMLD